MFYKDITIGSKDREAGLRVGQDWGVEPQDFRGLAGPCSQQC